MSHSNLFLSPPAPFVIVLCGLLLLGGCQSAKVPASPDELTFPSTVDWPSYEMNHFRLDNGVQCFVAENHELPLVKLVVKVRSGEVDVPAGKEGLAQITAQAMRSGGSDRYPEDELNRKLENRAAQMGISFDLDSGEASLNCLSQDFKELLPVFLDVLRHPALPSRKIALAKAQLKTEISRRNDETKEIGFRKLKELVYGKDTVYSRVPQYASVEAVSRRDLKSFQERAFTGSNMIVGLVGDFETESMKELLKEAFSRVPPGSRKSLSFPQSESRFEPGVYFVDKPDVNQTFVLLGHLGGYRQNPDYAALQVFNQVLSGGFSGRLFESIRTEKGLAYSVFGDFGCNVFYPGMFFVGLETKTDRTAEAVRAVRSELRRMQQQGVTEEELRQAKDQFLNSLVFRYESPLEVLKRRLYYAYSGMDQDSFEQLIEEIKAVGPKDVHRVAREYIRIDELKVLLVGSEDELQQQLDRLGAVRELKLEK